MPGEEAHEAEHRGQHVEPLGEVGRIEAIEPGLVGNFCHRRPYLRQVGDRPLVVGESLVEVLRPAIDHAE